MTDEGNERYGGSIEYPVTCYLCDNKGHVQKYCPTRFDEHQSIAGSGDSQTAAESETVVSAIASEEED